MAARDWILLLTGLACLPSLACTASPGPSATGQDGPDTATPSPPNIVLVVVDDLGWEDVGYQGAPFLTPHVDRLAAESLVFRQGYAAAPNCAPSRAALLSGAYGPRTGVYTVGEPNRGRAEHRKLDAAPNRTELEDEVATFAEALRPAGYESIAIGKWHLGADPRDQGFDRALAGNRRGHPKSYFSPYKNPDLEDGEPGEYLTERLVDEALAFLGEEREGPFLLYLSTFSVHTPIQPREEDLERTTPRFEERRKRRYAAMVEGLDRDLGRLLAGLEASGLARDTLVVFTSDNGGHGRFAHGDVLRGAKGMLYEGGVRVPLLLRWPGTIPPGIEDTPVHHVDLFPTLLELARVDPPDSAPRDGVSLTPLWSGEALAERDLYWHFPAYLESGGVAPGPWRTTPRSVIRRGRWKLIESFEDGALELYDLVADPGETRDLAREEPERRDALHARLDAWRKATGAALPTPPQE